MVAPQCTPCTPRGYLDNSTLFDYVISWWVSRAPVAASISLDILSTAQKMAAHFISLQGSTSDVILAKVADLLRAQGLRVMAAEAERLLAVGEEHAGDEYGQRTPAEDVALLAQKMQRVQVCGCGAAVCGGCHDIGTRHLPEQCWCGRMHLNCRARRRECTHCQQQRLAPCALIIIIMPSISPPPYPLAPSG